MRNLKRLEVFYHGKIVGYLAETPDHMAAFQYSDEWIRNGFSISPLSLPLKSDVFIPPEKCRDRFKGLFGVFADSLPDSWGELLLDRHLGSLDIGRGDISTFDRLAYIVSGNEPLDLPRVLIQNTHLRGVAVSDV